MNTVDTFSGSTLVARKQGSYDWTTIQPGSIYKAELGTDYTSAKGFLVSMTRYANDTNHSVERFVSDDGSSVEFRFTVKPHVSPENETSDAS